LTQPALPHFPGDEITSIVRRFATMPSYGETLFTLWVAMTHLAGELDCMPMLFVTSPAPNCGKSTVLDLVERFAAKPLVGSNASAAALFRIIEQEAPTLILDEVDTYMKTDESIRGIINSGHTRRGAFVLRCDKSGEGEFSAKRFSTWCPKALGGIGHLPHTIEDRSLIIQMERKLPGEMSIEPLRQFHFFDATRERLATWAQAAGPALVESIKRGRPEMPAGLSNRAADNWEPLFVIAALAGGLWPALARGAVADYVKTISPNLSYGLELLNDLRDVFAKTNLEAMPTGTLVEMLIGDDARPWVECNHGKPMTGRTLAKMLKPYGIYPQVLWSDGSTIRGYQRAPFASVWERYLPKL
jgi:putative DNA primase/helicase